MRIFVQIASYRDRELIPTIEDLLKKARYPQNLRFGICRQYHPADGFDNLDRYKKDKRFRIIDVLYTESKGVCWARNMTQQVYMGEEYTLQIDSHMRFAKHWDETLINMVCYLQRQGYPKPLLTGYMAGYTPEKCHEIKPDEPPLRMVFDRFTPEGAVVFKSDIIPGWKHLKHPVPARFYSAGFCFTLGIFCREVQHDPEFYFIGEEISITVRAFTHGYDLFHPHKNLLWHYYIRRKNKRQWEDDKHWGKKDLASHRKNRMLFGIEKKPGKRNFGKYGFGNVRSLHDYERYAGILFSKMAVQRYTIEGKLPPNPAFEKSHRQWLNSFFVLNRYCIKVHRKHFTETDYDFWVIAFHDANGETVLRSDANREEVKTILGSSTNFCEVWRDLYFVKNIKYWVLWPHSISKGWCKRISGSM